MTERISPLEYMRLSEKTDDLLVETQHAIEGGDIDHIKRVRDRLVAQLVYVENLRELN